MVLPSESVLRFFRSCPDYKGIESVLRALCVLLDFSVFRSCPDYKGIESDNCFFAVDTPVIFQELPRLQGD